MLKAWELAGGKHWETAECLVLSLALLLVCKNVSGTNYLSKQ